MNGVDYDTIPYRVEIPSGASAANVVINPLHDTLVEGLETVVLKLVQPPLLTPVARGWSDGYLYSIVRYGRAGMPQYGDKIIRRDERWAVVDYVRSLQAASPLPAAPAGGTK